MELEDRITFCQSDLPSALFAVFEDMRRNGEFCDVTITTKNNSFAVHRMILAAGIPYFRKAFLNCSTENEANGSELEGLDPDALETLIDFAYTSRLVISVDNVGALLAAAEVLQVNQVRDACTEFLSRRLSVSNFLQVFSLAHGLSNLGLVERTNHYIRQNFEEISESESFPRLPVSYVREVLSEDQLNVSSEEVVFEAVMKWVKASPEHRLAMLPELLNEVRLIHLPTDYLLKRVASEKLILFSKPCRDMVDKVKRYHLSKDRSLFLDLEKQPRNCSGIKDGIYAICESNGQCSIYYRNLIGETWQKMVSKYKNDSIYHVVALKGNIYMFLFETIQKFHVTTQEWQVLEPRHQNICGSALALHRNVIYCFGELFCNFKGKVRCFDTEQDNWLQEGKMMINRSHSAAVSLRDHIYVIGGYDTDGNYLNTVERYTPSTGEWREAPSMLVARGNHSCTRLKGKIFVCGGLTVNGLTNEVEMYDAFINEWTCISCMHISRYSASLIPHNSKIIALGDINSSNADAEIYDPESDRWKFTFPVPDGLLYAVSNAEIY